MKSKAVGAAQRLYESFFDGARAGEVVGKAEVPATPPALAVVGVLRSVVYESDRSGKSELYEHEFSEKNPPLLCCGPDGKGLWIVGGRFKTTSRGIEG